MRVRHSEGVANRRLPPAGLPRRTAAQWLACALPYRRFAIAGARLGASAGARTGGVSSGVSYMVRGAGQRFAGTLTDACA